MKSILGLDPGMTTGWALLGPYEVTTGDFGEAGAERFLRSEAVAGVGLVAIEWMQGMGSIIGAEVLDAARLVGRLEIRCESILRLTPTLLTRGTVKAQIIGKSVGTDAAVRGALMDRWGGSESVERVRSCPRSAHKTGRDPSQCQACRGTGILRPGGPLAGVKGHGWAALAVAVAHLELLLRIPSDEARAQGVLRRIESPLLRLSGLAARGLL